MKLDLSGKQVVVKNYARHKEELDDICRERCWAYEIRRDGSARIIRLFSELY